MRKMTVSLALAVTAAWLIPATLVAQDAKVAVVDMERAIVQSAEGKKSEAKFTARFEELRKAIEAKQKQLDDTQNKLKTQDKVLDANAKAAMTRDVTRLQTEIPRTQEDAQKELDSMRGDLMRPIAEVAETVLNKLAEERGYTVVIDSSNPQNSTLAFVNSKVDITDELIKRIDAEMAKPAATPAAPAPGTPGAPAAPKKPNPR